MPDFGGILGNILGAGGLGGALSAFGGASSPAAQEMQMRQYQMQYQMGLMRDQYNALLQQPGMTPDKAISIITNPSGPAAATQYGMHQFQGPEYGADTYKPPGPIYSGGQPINAPNASMQPQPSQQPAGGAPPDLQQALPIMNILAQRKAATAAGIKSAEQTATAQPDLPVLQNRAQQVISKLQGIRDNPELPNVVGGPLGIKGRTGPLGQGQSDLLSDIQDANNALQGDLFTSMRAVSGRGISPGALKELRITDLNSRTGTVQGYKDNINKTIKQIQDEYAAGWEARGKPDAYKPNWGSSGPTNSPVPPQAAAYLKANPHLRTQFDAKYGNGAALSVLGQ